MTDQELIIKQCEIQEATSEREVRDFGFAYHTAKIMADDEPKISDDWRWWAVVKVWASLINGKEMELRKVPVTFANGNQGLKASLIAEALDNLYVAMTENRVTPLEAYTEFEKIHPYEDGNGRVGHLIWAVLTQYETGKWPMKLPPDVFGERE